MKAGLCRGAGCTSVSIPLLSRSVTMPQPFEFSWSWLSARMMDLLSRRPVLACGVGGGRPAACAGVLGSPVVAKGGTRAMAASGLSLSAAAAAPWFGIWRAGGGMPAAELVPYFRQGWITQQSYLILSIAKGGERFPRTRRKAESYQCTMDTLSQSMKLQQLPEADADALLRLPADSES